MNIIISGWPGSGTTSLALLLCDLLEYKYLYGGGVFKYLAQKVVGDTSGPEFIKFEQNLGVAWDNIWEPYALWKLQHTDHMLIEGKTTGFFAESDQYYEIMMIAKVAARAARAVTDKRTDAQNTILARDVVVRKRWIDLFGIDIYDPALIASNYDLVVDSSAMSILDELQFVLQNLEEDYRFPGSSLHSQKQHAQEHVNKLLSQGKESFRADLNARGLIIPVETVLREWQSYFAEHVAKLPPELQNVVKAVH